MLQKIGKYTLKNEGGFVCRGQMAYQDNNGNTVHTDTTGDILLGQTRDVDPGSLGVPNGAEMWLFVKVVGGDDKQARQAFLFASGNRETAAYVITGTTLDNHLRLISVS